MNTNPNVIRILTFGDSNVWGRIPGDDNNARYKVNERWTGILQDLLGDKFEIIEEGLNGRTTNVESPHKAGKNGVTYLFSCLESHKPLDAVILFIGKNDLKVKYNKSSEDIADGVRECIEIIKKEGSNNQGDTPKIIIVSPSIIEEKERLRFGKKEVDFLGGKEKSIDLSRLYKQIAEDYSGYLLDLSEKVKVSDLDGVHLDKNEHAKVANYLYKLMSTISFQ